MARYYTGVGSRDISSEEWDLIVDIGKRMSELGYTLRSGGAKGADSAFEWGSTGGLTSYRMSREIYIPWNGFEKRYEGLNTKVVGGVDKGKGAKARNFLIQEEIIPYFDRMSRAGKELHARNYYQVVGFSGVRSKVCIYCADDGSNGEPKGGTRTAVLISRYFGIPTYNLRVEEQKDKLLGLLGLI